MEDSFLFGPAMHIIWRVHTLSEIYAYAAWAKILEDFHQTLEISSSNPS